MKPYYEHENKISLQALQTDDSLITPMYDEEIGYISQENVSMPFIRKYPMKSFGTGTGEWGKVQDFAVHKLHWFTKK